MIRHQKGDFFCKIYEGEQKNDEIEKERKKKCNVLIEILYFWS